MGKADLHLHTNFSDGFFPPEKVVLEAVNKGLNVIAITDHDIIESAFLARKFAKKEKLPIDVIVGEEITTKQGEVIGLFLKKRIPLSLNNVFDVAREIRKQNGLVIVPHPSKVIFGYGLLFKTIDQLYQANLIDGMEIYNLWDFGIRLAQSRINKNQNWQLAAIGASDSHHIRTIGEILTEFPGKNADDLRKAIIERSTSPKKGIAFPLKILKIKEAARHLFLRAKNGYPNRVKKTGFVKKLLHMLE